MSTTESIKDLFNASKGLYEGRSLSEIDAALQGLITNGAHSARVSDTSSQNYKYLDLFIIGSESDFNIRFIAKLDVAIRKLISVGKGTYLDTVPSNKILPSADPVGTWRVLSKAFNGFYYSQGRQDMSALKVRTLVSDKPKQQSKNYFYFTGISGVVDYM
jgi:hypothetical protein